MKKAISPILSILLITVAIIAAELIVYGWAMSYYGQQLATAGTKITIINAAFISSNDDKCKTCHQSNYGTSSNPSKLITPESTTYPPRTVGDWTERGGCKHCHLRIGQIERVMAKECDFKKTTYVDENYVTIFKPYGIYTDMSGFKTPRLGFEPKHGITGAYAPCTSCHTNIHDEWEGCYNCHYNATRGPSTRSTTQTYASTPPLDCKYCHPGTKAGSHPQGISWDSCRKKHGDQGGENHNRMLHTDVARKDRRDCWTCHGLPHTAGSSAVTIYVSNTGTQDTNISRLYINGREYKFYIVYGDLTDGLSRGEIVGLRPIGFPWKSGTTYEITVVTDTGVEATLKHRT